MLDLSRPHWLAQIDGMPNDIARANARHIVEHLPKDMHVISIDSLVGLHNLIAFAAEQGTHAEGIGVWVAAKRTERDACLLCLNSGEIRYCALDVDSGTNLLGIADLAGDWAAPLREFLSAA